MSKAFVWIFYLLTAFWAAGQIFAGAHAGVQYIADISIALAPTMWFLHDAKSRRIYVPHVVQPLIMFAWPIVLSIYVLRTRRWRGLRLLLIHGIATVSVNAVAFYATFYFVFGSSVYR